MEQKYLDHFADRDLDTPKNEGSPVAIVHDDANYDKGKPEEELDVSTSTDPVATSSIKFEAIERPSTPHPYLKDHCQKKEEEKKEEECELSNKLASIKIEDVPAGEEEAPSATYATSVASTTEVPAPAPEPSPKKYNMSIIDRDLMFGVLRFEQTDWEVLNKVHLTLIREDRELPPKIRERLRNVTLILNEYQSRVFHGIKSGTFKKMVENFEECERKLQKNCDILSKFITSLNSGSSSSNSSSNDIVNIEEYYLDVKMEELSQFDPSLSKTANDDVSSGPKPMASTATATATSSFSVKPSAPVDVNVSTAVDSYNTLVSDISANKSTTITTTAVTADDRSKALETIFLNKDTAMSELNAVKGLLDKLNIQLKRLKKSYESMKIGITGESGGSGGDKKTPGEEVADVGEAFLKGLESANAFVTKNNAPASAESDTLNLTLKMEDKNPVIIKKEQEEEGIIDDDEEEENPTQKAKEDVPTEDRVINYDDFTHLINLMSEDIAQAEKQLSIAIGCSKNIEADGESGNDLVNGWIEDLSIRVTRKVILKQRMQSVLDICQVRRRIIDIIEPELHGEVARSDLEINNHFNKKKKELEDGVAKGKPGGSNTVEAFKRRFNNLKEASSYLQKLAITNANNEIDAMFDAYFTLSWPSPCFNKGGYAGQINPLLFPDEMIDVKSKTTLFASCDNLFSGMRKKDLFDFVPTTAKFKSQLHRKRMPLKRFDSPQDLTDYLFKEHYHTVVANSRIPPTSVLTKLYWFLFESFVYLSRSMHVMETEEVPSKLDALSSVIAAIKETSTTASAAAESSPLKSMKTAKKELDDIMSAAKKSTLSPLMQQRDLTRTIMRISESLRHALDVIYYTMIPISVHRYKLILAAHKIQVVDGKYMWSDSEASQTLPNPIDPSLSDVLPNTIPKIKFEHIVGYEYQELMDLSEKTSVTLEDGVTQYTMDVGDHFIHVLMEGLGMYYDLGRYRDPTNMSQMYQPTVESATLRCKEYNDTLAQCLRSTNSQFADTCKKHRENYDRMMELAKAH